MIFYSGAKLRGALLLEIRQVSHETVTRRPQGTMAVVPVCAQDAQHVRIHGLLLLAPSNALPELLAPKGINASLALALIQQLE